MKIKSQIAKFVTGFLIRWRDRKERLTITFQFTWFSDWRLTKSAEPPEKPSSGGGSRWSTSFEYNNSIIVVVVGSWTFGRRCSAVRRHPSCGSALDSGTFDGSNGTGYFSRVQHPIFRSDGHLSRPLVGRVKDKPAEWKSHSRFYTLPRR